MSDVIGQTAGKEGAVIGDDMNGHGVGGGSKQRCIRQTKVAKKLWDKQEDIERERTGLEKWRIQYLFFFRIVHLGLVHVYIFLGHFFTTMFCFTTEEAT